MNRAILRPCLCLVLLVVGCDASEPLRPPAAPPEPAGTTLNDTIEPTSPATTPEPPATDPAAAELLARLFAPLRPGTPADPALDVPVVELGETRLDALPPGLRDPRPTPLTAGSPVTLWVSSRVARQTTRADRVHLVRFTTAPGDPLVDGLEARLGPPLRAADDSGVLFRGGRLQADYWFDRASGVQLKRVQQASEVSLTLRRYRPLTEVLGEGGRFGVEPPDGLLGQDASEAVERAGDAVEVLDEGVRLAQVSLPGIEAGGGPVRLRWRVPAEGGAIARFWLEIGHATGPGPFDADAVVAAIEAAHGRLGDDGAVEVRGRRLEVDRVTAAGLVRLTVLRSDDADLP